MTPIGRTVLALAVLVTGARANGQTAREQAVAIDRIEVPRSDELAIEQIGPPLAAPWSLAFLPDRRFLVTEKHGGIRIIWPDGRATGRLTGGRPANVLQKSDSGLLDIVLDPDFQDNRLVFVAFAEGTQDSNRTAIWKARLEGDVLIGGQVIFRVNQPKKDASHPGGRMLFLPDKTLLLTVGDGFDFRDSAQDPASHLGKVLRVTRDGKAPDDNPFIGRTGFAPEIWTMGHRNIQGLMLDRATGKVWSHEHGPRGGDEVNLLVAGANYGWPLVSWGIDYDGTRITNASHRDGMEDPVQAWVPSIAPSGLALYHGEIFPEWEGQFLVGALAARCVVRLRIGKETGLLVEEARMLSGLRTRIRDVRAAPDGNVYLLTDEAQGHLLRLVHPIRRKSLTIRARHPLAFRP